MYVQNLFQETRAEVLHELMLNYSLGTLVVTAPLGMEANHLPIEIDASSEESAILRCHVGRTNPIWTSCTGSTEAMVIFRGPNAYLSPRWYINGQKSKRVLPSWNFAVVHAYGTPRIVDDKTWLLRHLAALTTQNERHLPQPWSLEEAAPEFVAQSADHLIGIEIRISRLVGKWFTSQQRTPADRESLADALRNRPSDQAAALADLILRVDQG